MTFKSFVEEWEIVLPDGTMIRDEIQYSYQMSPIGVEIVPQKNRRIITSPDGDEEYMPVPEDYEQNRIDLCDINFKWKKQNEKYFEKHDLREKDYLEYSKWIKENLNDTSLTSLLMTFAPRSSNVSGINGLLSRHA